MTTIQEFELEDSPLDGITNICFNSNDSKHLLVSSWDKTLRLYDVTTRRLIQKFENQAALMDCCFGQGSVAYSASADSHVTFHDLETQKSSILGRHFNGVRCVQWSSNTNSLYSGSWDNTIRIWDSRNSNSSTIYLPGKVFSMDLLDQTLAVAMSSRKIQLYDIRNTKQPIKERDPTLKYMLKCIRLMPDAKGYACSSIEGRVMLDYFEDEKVCAFKLHRQTFDNTEVVYPVNALAFHPTYGTFASGGSDCMVNIWDGENKKRLKQFTGYSEEIACLDFNHDGSMLAIASSYTFDEGERDHAPDTIYIRNLQENEVKPRM